MDNLLVEHTITCPYCGESIVILLDASAGDQTYIEDCQVCCQPMQIGLAVGSDYERNVQVDRAD
ncbi:MAG: CPXCG motif-containing cysteine-rich protein [Woeseiaceae bacterium]